MPLLRETKEQLGSPYLLDHADNPVDWWSWGLDALDHARELDRPIFLSIGYASCHWCHVMAHESFEDPTIARSLNDSFVSIKVDREERPDLDAIYMAATQLASGHGGWPMSVFLLPDGRPFMAGTYYPPQDHHGQIGFTRLLDTLADLWSNRREAVTAQADELQRALEREISFVDRLGSHREALDLGATRRLLRDELVARVDQDGGFGDAPKFPRPSYCEALSEFDDGESSSALARTLDAMSRRGLYDHLRGGFARYSVDAQWHVPHFEKMLSDQALLARGYLLASRRDTSHPEWRDVALDTLRFVVNDLSVPSGYASSLDADAGGVEGSHVTWSVAQVVETLGDAGRLDDLDRVLSRWRITSPGLFEGRSIPRLGDDEPFVTPPELLAAFDALRRARGQRIQPGRDGKVVLEWNAMFASACILSLDPELSGRGLTLLESLPRTHLARGQWWRTEHREAHAGAADVAWLLDAHLDAFEATGQDRWLEASRELCAYLLAHYWDGEVPSSRAPRVGEGFFSSSDLVNDLVARPKDVFDAATPSSHAVACRAIARLALCDGDNEMLCVAQRLVELAAAMIESHPSAVPDLVRAAGFALDGVEIVIPGEPNQLSDHVRLVAMPDSVLITGSGSSALLRQREAGLAYVCRAGVCQSPASSIDELDEQLRRARR